MFASGVLLAFCIVASANVIRTEQGAKGWRTFGARCALYALGSFALIGIGSVSGADITRLMLLACVSVICFCLIETDLRWLFVPDLAPVILIACALLKGPEHWADAIFGCLIAGGLLLTIKVTFQLVRGIDGLGWGDVKLAAGMGALLGPMLAMSTIAAAALGSTALLAVALVRQGPIVMIEGRPAAPLGVGLGAATFAAFSAQLFGLLQ